MNTVRGIEAIKHYMPPTKEQIRADIKEEKCQTTTITTATKTIATSSTSQNVKEKQAKLMTSVERYRQEWTLLLHLAKNNTEKIRDIAFHGSLKVSKFRSIYWSILLRALNPDPNTWMQQRQQQRQRYHQLNMDFVKNPHEAEGTNDNPLSQSTQSIWNQFFNDQELISIIKQDVVRTFPGVDFFRKSQIQNAMCNILFYYAREHPYMSYRQGMHEILAPLLFVLYGDQQSLLHFKEVEQQQIITLPLSDTLQYILNADYLEADTYILFARLMSLIESYYRVPNIQNLEDCLDTSSMHSYKTTNELEVIGQLNSIRDKILAKEDLHLHNYLMQLEIPLHIFGIRWLRLLFGREFPLLDLLMLWDAIFADSDSFRLPNYILVAMLIRIRDKLILSDFTTCMTFLMRYPTNVDVNVILQHALHMHMPKCFDMPPNAFIYFMNPKILQTTKELAYNSNVNTDDIKSAWANADLSAVLPTAATTLINMHGAQNCKAKTTTKTRSSSYDAINAAMPISYKQQQQQQQKRELQSASTSAPNKGEQFLQHELRKSQAVIKITHKKLQNYLKTLRKHTDGNMNQKTPSNAAQEVRNTLDDMEELCNFLNLNFVNLKTTPIDQALEANETQQQKQKTTTTTTADEKTKIKNNLTLTKINIDELKIDDDAVSPTLLTKTLYERPDPISNSKLLLSDIKDFELIQISKAENALDVIVIDRVDSAANNSVGSFPLANPLHAHKS